MSSRSARLDFRRIADRAIAQRRQELSSHPAIGEAFKDATLVVNQVLHSLYPIALRCSSATTPAG